MSNNAKEPVAERPNSPHGYDKGRLMMAAYLTRIKANRNTKDKLTAMVDAKTNTITKYV